MLLIFVLFSPFFARSDKSGNTGSSACDSGKKNSDCGTVCPTGSRNVKITLGFDASNDPLRVCPVPEFNSDPAIFGGTNSVSDLTSYYCVVTVNGNVSQQCAITGSTRNLTAPFGGGERAISVIAPNDVVSTYKVDFYEKCNSCRGVPGRPYFTFTGTLGSTQTFAFANLLYAYTNPC